MARVYDSWSEMQADLNDGFDIDRRELFCARCGSPDVAILTMPDPRGWMTRVGKARCNSCGVEFAIRASDEDGE